MENELRLHLIHLPLSFVVSSSGLVSVETFLFVMLIFFVVHVAGNGQHNGSNHAEHQHEEDFQVAPSRFGIFDMFAGLRKCFCMRDYVGAISCCCPVKLKEFEGVN